MIAIWNIYLRDNGERVMRPVPKEASRNAAWIGPGEWFVGRTPAFMTREQAEEWHDAMACLGKALKHRTWQVSENINTGAVVLSDSVTPWPPESGNGWLHQMRTTPTPMTLGEAARWFMDAGARPRGSTWRPCGERPTPADSPILLRGQTPGAPPCLMAWHEGCEPSEWAGLLSTEQARSNYERACAPHWYTPAPDTGPYGGEESFAEFTADELAELMETHEIEWRPLDLGGDA